MARRIVAALVVAIAALGCGADPAASNQPSISHVVVIAMENHNRTGVIGTASYMTSLAKTYGEATHYTNLTHPSLPNYMAVTGGSTAGITTDCSPSASCGSSGPSIFSQVTWKSYEESMPKACDKTNASPYAVKHNPAAYYRTLTNCSTNDVALPSTPSLAAAFTFITPNLCHDMHDCSVATADTWLKGYLPKLMATTQYKAGTTAIFVWWDENSGSSASLPFIVVSPYTHGVSYTASINHYDTLYTIQSLLGKPCIANSCGQTNFASAFGL